MKVEQLYINATEEQSESDRTPIKQRLRKSKISQTERKVKKAKNRRLSSCDMPLNFTVASPVIEKIKKKPLLAQDIISPSRCFVSVQRLRLSKLGLQKNIPSPSVQVQDDFTDCKDDECDIPKLSIDVETRKYVIHPRFLDRNNISGLKKINGSDEELEDTLNSTFTLLPVDGNIDEKEIFFNETGTDIGDTDATNSKDNPNECNKRSLDKTELSINDIDNFYSDKSMDTSSRNFSNVTLRKRNSRTNTFNSIDDSSNDTEYYSPHEGRRTFDKIIETTVKNVSERSCKEGSHEDNFALYNDGIGKISNSCVENKHNLDDVEGNVDAKSLQSNKNDGITSDNNSEFVAAVDQRLTFDIDDIKRIKDFAKTNVEENVESAMRNSNSINLKQPHLGDDCSVKINQTLRPITWKEMKNFSMTNKSFGLENKQKRPSIIKKLSKFKKPKNELGKLSSTSKTISRGSQLVSSVRTPKVSGSKALQLYDFLSDEMPENTSAVSHDETYKSNSALLPEHKDKMIHNSILLENSPPSGSSTPKILKKHVVNSLMKSTLRKQAYNVSLADESSSTDNFKKKFVPGKMPNFALLHKKQFAKMENISEYKERKSERAKLLLSGSKPLNDTLLRPVNKKIIKSLLVDPIGESVLIKEAETDIDDSIVLPDLLSSIYPENKENLAGAEKLDSKMLPKSKKKVTMNLSPETPGKKSGGVLLWKTPFKMNLKSPAFPDAKAQFDSPKVQRLKTAPKNSNDNVKSSNPRNLQAKPKLNVNNNALKKAPLASTNPIFIRNNNVKQRAAVILKNGDSKETTGHTRFGFKVPVKLKKDDAIKAVSDKTRIPKSNGQEEKRAFIKGVRSNRRFDLLMEMRNKK